MSTLANDLWQNDADALKAARARIEVLEAALRKVNASCDHTDDCDRAQEWAINITPCTCCMRDVERALEGK